MTDTLEVLAQQSKGPSVLPEHKQKTTNLTSKPISLMALAVPPEATSLSPACCSFLARSSSPALLDTLRIAAWETQNQI